MAEPTFSEGVGRSNTVMIPDSSIQQGVDVLTVYGYQNYVPLRSKSGAEFHIILGTGAPSDDATYDSAPLASIYINLSGGDGVCMYLKEAVGGTGWAPVTTGSQA